VKFLCEQCKAKYQIADEKAVGKTVRMKCRKCGHLIEVRAAVTETSVSSALPEHIASGVPHAPPPAAPPATPQAPVQESPPAAPLPAATASPVLTGTFATGGAGAIKVAPRPERPAGALEGAFKSAVQSEAALAAAAVLPPRPPPRDEEPSTPFDMSDLSPSDEWYVAINGVPVGPVRVVEIRRKAALGAVTEDSLVWQEGLDEWRPLRSFPELAAGVREATRMSRPPTAEMRATAPPPPPPRSARPVPSGNVPRAIPPRATAPVSSVAPIARSNVVPIMSRLATAEKLEPVPQPRNSPVPGPPAPPPPVAVPSVVPDPFGSAAAAQPIAAAVALPAAASIPPTPSSRQVNWIPLAMVAMAVAFGVTAAIAIFRPAAPAPAPTAEQPAPVAAAPEAVPTATATPAATATETAAPAGGTTPAAPRSAGGPKASGATANAGSGRSLDLHSLTQNGVGVLPTDDPGGATPKAAGQSLTESQVQQAVALHRTAINRGCWERNPTTKQAVNVNVTLTVGGDGSAQNVAASGDDPSVAKCIENDVRGWRFPATGSPQKIAIPFKFVRQ
jgi:predicted Zn finger-like uncharacterized protein